MATEEARHPKWEGQASAEVKGSNAQQVWPLIADFCNVHKWFPNLQTCYYVEGTSGQPGLVRHCIMDRAGTTVSADEKLLVFDPINRSITYEAGENTMGLKSYVATMQVVPINNNNKNGCKIVWSYNCDAIEGSSMEDFNSFFEFSLQGMANTMELALIGSESTTAASN